MADNHFRIMKPREEEILRRAACLKPSAAEEAMMKDCLKEAEYLIDYKIKERNRPLAVLEKMEPSAPAGFAGQGVKEILKECDAVIIFTALLGDAFTEHLAEEEDDERRIFLQAVAAERLDAICEAYCDAKEAVFRKSGAYITPRYPWFWEGYPEGPTVTTCVFGISMDPNSHAPERCRSCFLTDCPGRKEET